MSLLFSSLLRQLPIHHSPLSLNLSNKDQLIQLLVQFTIHSYYFDRPLGQLAYDLLWMHLGIPYEHNLNWYIDALNLEKVDISNLTTIENYYPCNPSILPYQKGFLINIRQVNYKQEYALNYKTLTGHVNTRNIIAYVDENFNLVDKFEIIENPTRPCYPSLVTGMEDIRLFWSPDGYLHGSCTILDAYPERKIAIGYFKTLFHKDSHINETLNVDVQVLASPYDRNCEKNWLPFVLDDKIHFFYDTGPLEIYSPPGNSMIIPDFNKHKFRASAGPLLYKEGYLVLVHNHLWQVGVEKGRNYIHRFLYLSKDWKILSTSPWFYFEHAGIEFSLSMCFHNDKLLIGYGKEDCQAYVGLLSLDKLNSMLKEVPVVIWEE